MAALLKRVDKSILQLDEAINSDEIRINRWDWYPMNPGLARLIFRFEQILQSTTTSEMHIDLSNGIPFYYNQADETLIINIIKSMLKDSNMNTEFPNDILRLIFIFLKTKYKSHLSTKMKPSLITLSDNDTNVTAGDNEVGICRFEYPLPKNEISIWYILLSHNGDCMDAANTFGVISNYDKSMISKDGIPLFPSNDPTEPDEIPPDTFYGLCGLYRDEEDTNWIQKDYNWNASDLKFRMECDLRRDRNHLTIYDMQTKEKIGYKDLDYTVKLPLDTDKKKYVWYPCICPWGPICMRIAFHE